MGGETVDSGLVFDDKEVEIALGYLKRDDPDSLVMTRECTVREMMEHIEARDEIGHRYVAISNISFGRDPRTVRQRWRDMDREKKARVMANLRAEPADKTYELSGGGKVSPREIIEEIRSRRQLGLSMAESFVRRLNDPKK